MLYNVCVLPSVARRWKYTIFSLSRGPGSWKFSWLIPTIGFPSWLHGPRGLSVSLWSPSTLRDLSLLSFLVVSLASHLVQYWSLWNATKDTWPLREFAINNLYKFGLYVILAWLVDMCECLAAGGTVSNSVSIALSMFPQTLSVISTAFSKFHLEPHILVSPNFNPINRLTTAITPLLFFVLQTTLNLDRSENNRKSTHLVSLDLSAAFETIDHCILLNRLESTPGIRGTAPQRITSYLIKCSQYFNLSDSWLNRKVFESGLYQGSMLGPLLCTMWVSNWSPPIRALTADRPSHQGTDC